MSSASRRAFLKAGAVVAAPIAALAPAAVLAADPRLARWEDERALGGLLRAFLARFNGTRLDDCGQFIARAGAIQISPEVSAILPEPAAEPEFTLEGNRAQLKMPTKVRLESSFDGGSTLEKMARFQGQPRASYESLRSLVADFARTPEGWTITRLALN